MPQFLFNRKIVFGSILLISIFLLISGMRKIVWFSPQEVSVGEPVGVEVNLSTQHNKTTFSAAEDIMFQVSITNPGNDPIKILRWLTPLDGVKGPLFIVSRDGNPVEYLGPIYKRAAPTEQDYTTLTPGETLASEVNLSTLYDFSTSGNYKISFQVDSKNLYLKSSRQQKTLYKSGELTSNTLELSVEKHSVPALPMIDIQAAVGSNSFNNCSPSRQTDLINARSAASTYANEVVSYFSAYNHGMRYSTWFGTYDLTRYNTVSSHFSAIRNAMDTASMNFDCTCTDPSVYAFVNPALPYNINLCGAFWSAPTMGTDSKAGTLIHETSHFYVVAGTDDYAYGQSASQALAVNNPASAIMNADSHEYFAENNPPIIEPSMGMANGNFEAGKTSWTEYSSNGWSIIDQFYDGTGYPPLAHSGTWYTWLGGDYNETSSISQSFSISVYSPYLRLWYLINSNETCGKDHGYIKLNSSIVHTWDLCNANGTTNWQMLTLNVSAFSGQTVLLEISALTTPSTISDLFIDDVSFSGTFTDVPANYWAWQYIESLYNASITSGCGTSPLIYCPESPVTRAQMAVFLEKSMHGSSFSPPNIVPTFNDTVGHWAEDWIEALQSDGVTGGCGNGIFCPDSAVTRAQMAVFLLKAKYGSSYLPPSVGAGTGFSDVPTTHWAAGWIKQLAAESITGGCGTGVYCPDSSVTRAQMAVFLQKTFNFTLPK